MIGSRVGWPRPIAMATNQRTFRLSLSQVLTVIPERNLLNRVYLFMKQEMGYSLIENNKLRLINLTIDDFLTNDIENKSPTSVF